MQPKTLSASTALIFEGCEARFKAEAIDKTPDIKGKAGSLGNAVHEVLQFWVENQYHNKNWGTVGERRKAIQVVWETVYPIFFPDRSHYDEGLELLHTWVDRTVFTGRQVLSCEVKDNFELPTSKGKLPVTYIWDRADKVIREDGSWDIEVVDYKTVIQPVTPEELKQRIQPRLYALAAAIKYPDATDIWITYDLLRHDTVSTKFTRDDNIITWKYLQALAERIYLSDGTRETLNTDCRYCVRKLACKALEYHLEGGGILGTSFSDLADIIKQRAQIKSASDALYAVQCQLDDQILALAEEQELLEFQVDNIKMNITASSRRHVDSERVASILPPEILAKYASLGVGDLDVILKEEELTPEQRSELKTLVTRKYGEAKVKTKTVTSFKGD